MNRNYWNLIGATLLWASVFHVGKFALATCSPLTVAVWRYGVAGLILLVMALPEIRANWKQIASHWILLPVLALSGVVGFGLSIFYGLRLTSPVNAALIMAFNPSMIIIVSTIINRERIRSRQMAGLLLGLSGVLVVVSHGSLTALINLGLSHGDLLIGLATVCWTIYCVLPKRFAPTLPSTQLSSTTIILAGLILLPLAGNAAPDIGRLPDWSMLLVLLYLAIFGTALPYLWWNQGVQHFGPAKAGVFMNLVPIFASLMGVLMGQRLLTSQITGAILVIIGVLMTSLASSKSTQTKTRVLIAPAGVVDRPCTDN